ncbi:MAG TPA: hypothetical protein VFZ16_13800 [Hyphomicrobiaceae bacterium]|nr:hypothetical protein [Hyphomicrobiaceae bacterium]
MVNVRQRARVSTLAIAIAAALSLLFALPAAAHQAHENDIRAAIQTALPIAPTNAGTMLGQQSVVPAGVLSKFSGGRVGGADCCSSQTCTPCAGPCGAGLIATASTLGIPVAAIGQSIGRSEPQLAGRTVGPLEKPPRT